MINDDNDNVIKSYYQVHKKAPLVLKNESKYLAGRTSLFYREHF